MQWRTTAVPATRRPWQTCNCNVISSLVNAIGADKIECSDFGTAKAADYDAIAFGCPAMGHEVLEETVFQSMWDDVKSSLAGKEVALFGSYGWGDGQWMRKWEADAANNVVTLACESVIPATAGIAAKASDTIDVILAAEGCSFDMTTVEKSERLLYIGIVGCLLYVIGDFLFAATGRGQTTESIGFMVRVACLEMDAWRMVASILCGFVGTLMYYMGFHRMYGLLKCHVREAGNLIWVRLFRVAYVTGTVAWAYVHAMFMTVALIFKYTCQIYGDMQKAADIANRVFYANAAPMAMAYILCDVLLTVIMIALVWKRVIPLKSTGARILATLCNPMMLPGIVGNLLAGLPWPLNQFDHGTESFGHALVLILGLILLKGMARSGEVDRIEVPA